MGLPIILGPRRRLTCVRQSDRSGFGVCSPGGSPPLPSHSGRDAAAASAAVKEMPGRGENPFGMSASRRLSLVHLTQPPRPPSSPRPPLLLLLHGVGSHEGDLMGLAPYLDERFFIVSARGPVTIGPGMHGGFHVPLDPIPPHIHA